MWTEIIDGLCQIIKDQAALNQSLVHALRQHESVEGYELALVDLERRKEALLGVNTREEKTPWTK